MLRWQPQTQPSKVRKRARRWIICLASAVGLLALSFKQTAPLLVYNPSPSAPLGYYRTFPAEVADIGDWVLITPPERARNLADLRGYLPETVPMIKTIAAAAGDEVCTDGELIEINRLIVAHRFRTDHRGRVLPWWNGCRTLTADEIFVLNRAAPNSFDGRYFGPMSRQLIRARLVHL